MSESHIFTCPLCKSHEFVVDEKAIDQKDLHSEKTVPEVHCIGPEMCGFQGVWAEWRNENADPPSPWDRYLVILENSAANLNQVLDSLTHVPPCPQLMALREGGVKDMWPDCTCKLDAAKAGFAQIISLCRTMLEACRHTDERRQALVPLFEGVTALITAAEEVQNVSDEELGIIPQEHALSALQRALDQLASTNSLLLKPT